MQANSTAVRLLEDERGGSRESVVSVFGSVPQRVNRWFILTKMARDRKKRGILWILAGPENQKKTSKIIDVSRQAHPQLITGVQAHVAAA